MPKYCQFKPAVSKSINLKSKNYKQDIYSKLPLFPKPDLKKLKPSDPLKDYEDWVYGQNPQYLTPLVSKGVFEIDVLSKMKMRSKSNKKFQNNNL